MNGTPEQHHILIVEDDFASRSLLVSYFENEGYRVSETDHGEDLLQRVNEEKIDLVLLDIHMPGTNGFSGLVFLRGQNPGIPVVVVSGSEEPHVMKRAIDYGASGFIPKSAPLETISDAIKAVLEGEEWLPQEVADNLGDVSEEDQKFAAALAALTPQQFRVLTMLTEGLLNKQIAYELNVSEATIKAHVTAILRKLGVHSRTQAVIAAQRLGVEPPKTEVD